MFVGSRRLCFQFATLMRWRSPACARIFSFAPTLPVSGRWANNYHLMRLQAEARASHVAVPKSKRSYGLYRVKGAKTGQITDSEGIRYNGTLIQGDPDFESN
jgi:hypothetical protein